MLTREHLTALHRSLRHQHVLSVYLDFGADDPANRLTWRVELDHALKALRASVVSASRAERANLDRCLALLEGELAAMTERPSAQGWVAFITPGETIDAAELPLRVPTSAVWKPGPFLGPYVRALKELRPVFVAVCDARRVVLHRYALGAVEHVETIQARRADEPRDQVSAPPPNGFRSGARGRTGRDAAREAHRAGRDRMLADAAQHIAELAESDGWIVLGGNPRVAAQLAKRLPVPATRVLRTSLDVHATAADLAAEARAAASTLRNESDAQSLADIEACSRAGGPGVLAPLGVRSAIAVGSVSELYFTHQYLLDHPAEAEALIRGALDQNALVEDVTGAPAMFLDDRGGVAARLRWRTPEAAAEHATSELPELALA